MQSDSAMPQQPSRLYWRNCRSTQTTAFGIVSVQLALSVDTVRLRRIVVVMVMMMMTALSVYTVLRVWKSGLVPTRSSIRVIVLPYQQKVMWSTRDRPVSTRRPSCHRHIHPCHHHCHHCFRQHQQQQQQQQQQHQHIHRFVNVSKRHKANPFVPTTAHATGMIMVRMGASVPRGTVGIGVTILYKTCRSLWDYQHWHQR